jgi:CBASS immunity sensor of nucleotide second messenger signals
LSHLSVFALAPIPLLIYFGKQLGDVYPTDVYQRHRHPESWSWQDLDDPGFNYTVLYPEPADPAGDRVVVCLSLSGTIHPSEAEHAVGEDLPTYTLTISDPRRDFLRAKDQLELFRVEWARLLAKIREKHGPKAEIHLFPAIPNSVAVQIGRVILPKSDPTLIVYDHDHNSGGFRRIMSA